MTPICRECGNDEGPYAGLCLDCLIVSAPVENVQEHAHG